MSTDNRVRIRVTVVDDMRPFTPAQERRMRKMVEANLARTGQSGRSASGKTIAMAVDWCERKGKPYELHGYPGAGYFLQVKKS